jgi:hypothetical protein
MIAFGDGILFVQNGIYRPGDGLTVGDVHAAFLVQIQPQKPLRAFPNILHIPQGAAVGFHNGLCKLRYDVGNLHAFTSSVSGRLCCPLKRERLAPLSWFTFLHGDYSIDFRELQPLFANIPENYSHFYPKKCKNKCEPRLF